MGVVDFCKRHFGSSKVPEGMIQGSQTKKAVKSMSALNEQRERHGSHRRGSVLSDGRREAALILSDSSSKFSTTSFSSKNLSSLDRMAVENNLDTFGAFQKKCSGDSPKPIPVERDLSVSSVPTTASSCGDLVSNTTPKGAHASESLILPVPNRYSRNQLRFWEAVGATSDLPAH